MLSRRMDPPGIVRVGRLSQTYQHGGHTTNMDRVDHGSGHTTQHPHCAERVGSASPGRLPTYRAGRIAKSNVPEPFDRVSFVLHYIAAAQRARTSQSPADLDELRRFPPSDVVIRMASPWTETPWRVISTSADQVLHRLTDP